MGAVPVIYDTLEDAVKHIYSTNPDGLDGYATTTEIVQFLNQKYGGGAFLQTDPFLTSSNSPDQKAFALSKALPRDAGSLFNAALETHRVAGDVSTLYAAYVAPAAAPTEEQPFPLPEAARAGVTAAVVALTVALPVALLAAYAVHRRRRRPGSPRAGSARLGFHPKPGLLTDSDGGGGGGDWSNGGTAAPAPAGGPRTYRVEAEDAAAFEAFLAAFGAFVRAREEGKLGPGGPEPGREFSVRAELAYLGGGGPPPQAGKA